ncbi:solute carrier family 35 (adenosine 3'-phospho 5'-phosphosulfate transporter), member B3 [Paragonimus westermani]|uniref:Adenosine 3'-phospho 5'-phosphosulfate transporter 2 n=1 Tax=Paragonimus westermani TaxID=34504 RepID=A0A5J4NLD2_9TREM|nr:solute carrier family 35 (adenosine 3'-phospho 5'-phosphosulfate transporter), member B3 [Paragonimus westermani]
MFGCQELETISPAVNMGSLLFFVVLCVSTNLLEYPFAGKLPISQVEREEVSVMHEQAILAQHASESMPYMQIHSTNSKKLADVLVCGFNLSRLPRSTTFTICVVGIFVVYVSYGALQETIFHKSDMRMHSTYLTLYQFAIYSVLSYFELWTVGVPLKRAGLQFYCLLAFLTVGTIAFSNASVSYLNYPTQVIFKSCKMIPVLIGGVLVQKKSYTFLEIAAVLLLTSGLISFTMVDVTIQPSFTAIGLILVSVALCCDGALGNFQELVMRKFKCSNTEILFYSYMIGFCFMFSGLLLTGMLVPSVRYFAEVMTTFRKAVSIVLSFMLFEKPFSMGYVWSGLLVVLGLYLNLYHNNRQSWNKFIIHQFQKLGLLKTPLPTILPL